MIYLIYIFGAEGNWLMGDTLPSVLPSGSAVREYKGIINMNDYKKVEEAASDLVKKLQGKTVEEAKSLFPESLI